MKTTFGLPAFCAAFFAWAIYAVPASPINTPEPMQPGAYDKCEGFWPASPDSTCQDIAAEHGLTLDNFVAINPQIGEAGGCSGGGILPNNWYCIKAQVADEPTPGNRAGQNVNLRPTPPTSSTTVEEAPEPTPRPEDETPTCETDNCWRAFKLGRGRARESYSAWCSGLLDTSCNAERNQEIEGMPVLAQLQCPQEAPCSALSSACKCFTAGAMDAKVRV